MDEPESNEELEQAELPPEPERSPFAHPQWMVGIVLILGFWAFVVGFAQPIWWWIGSPLILALVVYVVTRLIGRR